MRSFERLARLRPPSFIFVLPLLAILALEGCGGTYSTTTVDTTPPSAPSGLTASAASATQINLTWGASTDNVGVTGHRVERCTGAGCASFVQVGTTATGTNFSDTGLTASTSYNYRVRATDAAGNLSSYSNTGSASTLAGTDTTPPTPPTVLVATAVSSSEIDLSWMASTDNVGVTGYVIQRCSGSGCTAFSGLGTTTSATTYQDKSVASNTQYTYRVEAQDATGNLSAFSNSSSATTPVAADTTPPTVPTNPTATGVSSTQINLSWTASTDNVGVTGYRIESCSGAGCSSFAQIGTATTTTFASTGLSASTSYTFRERASDAAGNLSNYSSTASATTSGSGSSITVSVSPRRGGLTTSQTLSITATLTNDTTNAGVAWSSSGGGSFLPTTSITGNPVAFTAPASAGVVTITATSLADGSKIATATIGVTDLTGVTTHLNGNLRQGSNQQEYALAASGPTAVNSTNFGKLFTCTVDAAVYAQPLWVANLTISGVKHNVVYVATQHDTVYAFDADAKPCTTLWQTGASGVNSLLPSGQTWVTSTDVSCTDLAPSIGIVGTPVIDLGTKTMYVVTKTKTTSGTTTYHQLLHALDITTGAEKFSGPVEISASGTGTGNGSVGGMLNFDPLINNERSALLLENGHVVIAWASHCDNGAYHGWLMSYSASALTQEAVLNVSPNGALNGIWMAGGGPAADSSGNIYFTTGNGTFDASSTSNKDYGDSIVKVGPPSGGTFPILSYFTPDNQASLESGDVDQGSGGLILLPDVTVSSATKSYLVQAGKDGNIYLADRSSLGGYNSSSNNVVQEVSGQIPGGIWGSPTYWNGSIYYGAAQDGSSSSDPLRAFSFNAGSSGQISSTPTSHSAKIFGFSGPTPPISSSGITNGIVWALDNSAWNSTCPSSCQVVYAYDATNLTTMLYNTTQASGNRDQDGGAVKFTVPTVANGKVYVGGTNTLTVYGLLP